MLYSCFQFFVHAHQISHRCMVPECNSIGYLLNPSHSIILRHLEVHFDFQFVLLLSHHGNGPLLTRTDTFAVKIVEWTATKWKIVQLNLIRISIKERLSHFYFMQFYSFVYYYIFIIYILLFIHSSIIRL